MRIIPRYQQGGAMPEGAPAEEQGGAPEGAPEAAQGGAPEQGQGQDPIMQLAQMSQEAFQKQDCNLALQVCQAFMDMMQQAQGGAPQEAPQGEPVYRKGGKIVYRIV